MKLILPIFIYSLFIGCSTMRHIDTNSEFTMQIGDKVEWDGKTVYLSRLIMDNRCPKDVKCIMAGHTVFEILVEKDTFKLDSDQPILSLGSHALHLTRVEPERDSKIPLKQDDYVLTLIIRSGSETSGY